MMLLAKSCFKCGELKQAAEFNRKSQNRDGRRPYCRPCDRSEGMQYHANSRERINLRKREYRRAIETSCAVDGCARKACTNADEALCTMHRLRVWKHGGLGPAESYMGGDNITYGGAHQRTESVRGKASGHTCPDCGEPAAEWSYDYACPRERTEWVADTRSRGKGLEVPYSPDPMAYSARCRPCHVKFDQGRTTSTAHLKVKDLEAAQPSAMAAATT
jgi:hypothetical protein